MISALLAALAPAPSRELTPAIAPSPVEATKVMAPQLPPAAAPPAKSRSRRRYLLAGAGAVVLLLFALVLFAVNRPHPTVTVSPASVAQGGTVTVSATGFAPGEAIDVYYVASSPVRVRSQRADTSGKLATSFAIPRELIPGRHLVRACAGQNCAGATVTVVR
jgi:hypothetical protein